MKEEVAKLWVEALRSRRYKQGVRALKNPDGTMCCLGVLCDISGLGAWSPAGGEVSDYVIPCNEQSAFLPDPVQRWAGVASKDPLIGAHSATELNDSVGLTFAALADQIELLWRGL